MLQDQMALRIVGLLLTAAVGSGYAAALVASSSRSKVPKTQEKLTSVRDDLITEAVRTAHVLQRGLNNTGRMLQHGEQASTHTTILGDAAAGVIGIVKHYDLNGAKAVKNQAKEEFKKVVNANPDLLNIIRDHKDFYEKSSGWRSAVYGILGTVLTVISVLAGIAFRIYRQKLLSQQQKLHEETTGYIDLCA